MCSEKARQESTQNVFRESLTRINTECVWVTVCCRTIPHVVLLWNVDDVSRRTRCHLLVDLSQVDVLLNGAGCDEPVHTHVAALAYPVSSAT